MTERHNTSHPYRFGKAIFLTVGIIMGGALLILWSWNTLSTGQFKLPDIQFKHALALELFILAVYLIPNTASQLLVSAHRP